MAVADVFDALTSDRVYRKAFSVEEAVQMMREQRGRHFDPVLLDAFMEVLGQTGPDARERCAPTRRRSWRARSRRSRAPSNAATPRSPRARSRPRSRTASRPMTLHAEVIGPALRRISVLSGAGEIDGECEHRAATITRRVLATLYRYMTLGTEQTRERVLLAGVQGDEHTLGLQMVHDQLAAAGFQTIFDTDLTSAQLLRDGREPARPDLVLVGATEPARAETVELALRELRAGHPELPIVLGGPAVGGGLPRERGGHERARADRRDGRGGRRRAREVRLCSVRIDSRG